MFYRLELTHDEIEDIFDVKDFSGSTIGYTLPPGLYEVSDINLMLKSLLPDKVKVDITIDDIRLRSNLTTNKTIRFTEKSFFHTILAFTKSHSGVLGDIDGFFQKIPGTYKREKPYNITGFDENHLRCDCIKRHFVSGARQLILYRFSLDKPPGHKLYRESGVKLKKHN